MRNRDPCAPTHAGRAPYRIFDRTPGRAGALRSADAPLCDHRPWSVTRQEALRVRMYFRIYYIFSNG